MARFTLVEEDIAKWKENVFKFLIPLALLYMATVQGVITQPGHLIRTQDFIPSPVATGGIILYAFDRIYDLLRKYVAK